MISESKTCQPFCDHISAVDAGTDTMHEAITTAPTQVNIHDSHFGAAAVPDAADLPAVYGGDNA